MRVKMPSKKITSFLVKPSVKSILLGVLVILIGSISSSLGNWTLENNPYFFLKLGIAILLFVIYIFFLGFYATYETNLVKINSIYKSQNDAYERAMTDLVSICEQTSRNVNKIIHNIKDKDDHALDKWSFDIECQLVCEKIWAFLSTLTNEKKFGVSYIRLLEESVNEESIKMIACWNDTLRSPTIYNKERNKIQDPYHDAYLFKINSSDIEILFNKTEIDKRFHYNNPEDQSSNKYSQFIGIPIFCNKDKGGKMVGLLEVVCFNGATLGNSIEEVDELVSKYLVPYSFLLLLLHKLEKALVAKHKDDKIEEETHGENKNNQ